MIRRIVTGRMETNCYLVADGGQAVIIDPGDDAQHLAETVSALSLVLTGIYLTHGHFDHMLAAMELTVMFSVPVHLDSRDKFLATRMQETAEYFLKMKIAELPPTCAPYPLSDKFTVGSLDIRLFHTPGHTPGSVSLYIPALASVFVGDTLFKGGGLGRTDFRYSDPSKLKDSVRKLLSLPANTTIYPGHGPETNVADELAVHGVQ